MEEEEIQNDRENNHENIQQKGVYEDGDMEDGKYSKDIKNQDEQQKKK